jgi:hypothetical protein
MIIVSIQRLQNPIFLIQSFIILRPQIETRTITSKPEVTEHALAGTAAVIDMTSLTTVRDQCLSILGGLRVTGLGSAIHTASSMLHARLGVNDQMRRSGGSVFLVVNVLIGRTMVLVLNQAMEFGTVCMLLLVVWVLPLNGMFPSTLLIFRLKCLFFI